MEKTSPMTDATFLGACPGCDSTRRRRWLRHPRLSLWLCEWCGLGYSDPQPRAFVDRRYTHEYDLARHFGELEDRKDALITRRLDRLPPPGEGSRLLDVGCADGQFAAAAQRRGWRATGIELNPPAAQRARERGIDVLEGHIEDVEVRDADYEVVTAWDVIEHVAEPQRLVTKLARLVAPGGLIVITTLNRHALVARTLRARWSMIVEDHFTYWDARSLKLVCARDHLQPVRETSFGLGRDFVSWIDRLRSTTLASSCRPARAAAVAPRPAWDVHPVVLATENALNRLLDATSTRVGKELVPRARPDGRVSVPV